MNRRRALSLCAALALVSVEVAGACTTFCASTTDAVLFGRNYDFEIGDGALMVNPRGLAKHALAARGPAWTASYGSLTFNQFGRDFPTGGMNEKGLVVELMWLSDTEYPPADSRPELGVLEWIQYQLDTAGSVADVLASDRAVRIAGEVPLHYLVSDASGTSAAVEFLRGRRQVRTGKDLPIAALANSTYDSSLSYLRSHARPPGGSSSQARFARAARRSAELASLSGQAAIDRAFAILDDVAQGSTRWSIVYDQTARTVHFRTDRLPAVRTLRLLDLDLSCNRPGSLLSLAADARGDVSGRLVPYTASANEALVRADYAASAVTRRIAPDVVAAVAALPASATCARP